jgi:hypothetical protein
MISPPNVSAVSAIGVSAAGSVDATGAVAVSVSRVGGRSAIVRGASAGVVGVEDRRGVSRAVLNFWLDAFLGVLFVLLSMTAVIVQFVFPPAVATRGWTLWGLTFGEWSSLQFGLLAVLGFGIIVHLMLHWTWVCGVAARRIFRQAEIPDSGLQTIYGVGLLIVVLFLGAVVTGVATMTIRMPAADSVVE